MKLADTCLCSALVPAAMSLLALDVAWAAPPSVKPPTRPKPNTPTAYALGPPAAIALVTNKDNGGRVTLAPDTTLVVRLRTAPATQNFWNLLLPPGLPLRLVAPPVHAADRADAAAARQAHIRLGLASPARRSPAARACPARADDGRNCSVVGMPWESRENACANPPQCHCRVENSRSLAATNQTSSAAGGVDEFRFSPYYLAGKTQTFFLRFVYADPRLPAITGAHAWRIKVVVPPAFVEPGHTLSLPTLFPSH